MAQSHRMWATAVLGVVPAMILAAALFVPPVAQDPRYHDFADQRTIWGIANFWNVVSNAAFLVTAAVGARVLRSTSAFTEDWERTAYCTLLVGTILVAFGSAYYHLQPNSETLFWDRLPMTIVFMSLFATTIGERIGMSIGWRSFLPLLLVGALSVVYWKLSGDLRFYAIVQFYPMLAIPVLLIFRPPRYTAGGGIFAMVILYAVAKALELFDRDLSWFSPAGGHPWKHVVSAAALLCYMAALGKRRNLGELVAHIRSKTNAVRVLPYSRSR